jgi:F-type H+-transporting ATPase subunit epsilon
MAEETAQSARIFHLEVVTPYELFYDGEAEMVVVSGVDGEFGVMAGHTPCVVALAPGEIRILLEGEWRTAAASNGYAEVDRDHTTIVTTSAEWAEDIDAGRAQRALERAQARIADPATTQQEVERSRIGTRRAKARLHVASEHQRRGRDHGGDHSTRK